MAEDEHNPLRDRSEDGDGLAWTASAFRRGRVALAAALAIAGLVVAVGSAGWVGGSGSRAIAEDDEAGEENSLVFQLAGPNDGELINGRCLPLELRTNYIPRGKLAFLVNGREVLRRPLFCDGGFRDARNIYVSRLTLDMVSISRSLGDDLLGPDAGPVRVLCKLFSPDDRFVTSYLWSGYVGKPWVELTTQRLAAEAGLVSPAGDATAADAARLSSFTHFQLHASREDVFYLLVVAPRRDILERSPNDPALVRDGRLLETGAFSPAPAGQPARASLTIDTRRQVPAWPQAYVVLWALDSAGEWKRSTILPLALR